VNALPASLRAVIPADTAATWVRLAPVIPAELYLAGGTGLAVHLQHRESRDLDFFYHRDAIDLDALADALGQAGPFAIAERSPGTLNGVFAATKVQFLNADQVAAQHLLEPPSTVAGLRVASVSDIFAMKLRMIAKRGELRDYSSRPQPGPYERQPATPVATPRRSQSENGVVVDRARDTSPYNGHSRLDWPATLALKRPFPLLIVCSTTSSALTAIENSGFQVPPASRCTTSVPAAGTRVHSTSCVG
jgi:hypothetical protein